MDECENWKINGKIKRWMEDRVIDEWKDGWKDGKVGEKV